MLKDSAGKMVWKKSKSSEMRCLKTVFCNTGSIWTMPQPERFYGEEDYIYR